MTNFWKHYALWEFPDAEAVDAWQAQGDGADPTDFGAVRVKA